MLKVKIFKVIILISCILIGLDSDVISNTIEEETSIQENVTNQISENFNLETYINDINNYVEDTGIEGIDFQEIASSLIKSNNIDYKNIVAKLLSFFAKEVMGSLKGAISIYFIVIIMAIISNIELEKKSDITKIAHLSCFAALATITIVTFLYIITSFKEVVSVLTTLMQVISPFLMAVLISTGAITSTGIIQPMVLFVASAVGFIVNYLVIPFFSISVAINVICSISENLKLSRMSKLFSSSAIWIVGILFTFFLGVLSLETTLTSSVDSLAVKTTQAAVSNFVPVVGKFFSDSFETVVGATKVISSVGGTIGIISVLIVAVVPIIKIASVMRIIYGFSSISRAYMSRGKCCEVYIDI